MRFVGGHRGPAGMPSEYCAVGLSTGLLAAAVVALSPSIPALMPLAVEAVLIAFRLGLHVKIAASHLEISPAHEDGSSWTYAIAGMTKTEAETALTGFHQDKVTQPTNFTGKPLLNVLARMFRIHTKYISPHSVPTP